MGAELGEGGGEGAIVHWTLDNLFNQNINELN